MTDITGREYIYGIAQDTNGAPYLFNIGELVRCKDCKHYREVTTNYGICYERPNVITSQKADDFCSYGERKGGDSE